MFFNKFRTDKRQKIKQAVDLLQIRLSRNEKLLYHTLLDACDTSTLQVSVSLTQLSNETTMSKNTVKSCREKLRKLNLIDFEKEENSLTVYTILGVPDANKIANDEPEPELDNEDDTNDDFQDQMDDNYENDENDAVDENDETDSSLFIAPAYNEHLFTENTEQEPEIQENDVVMHDSNVTPAKMNYDDFDFSIFDYELQPLIKQFIKNRQKLNQPFTQQQLEDFNNSYIFIYNYDCEVIKEKYRDLIQDQIRSIQDINSLQKSDISLDFVPGQIVEDVKCYVLKKLRSGKEVSQKNLEQLYQNLCDNLDNDIVEVGKVFEQMAK